MAEDIGEKALSKAAEVGLETQLDQAEDLDVDLETNPLKLMGGKVESVKVKGKGLVMQQELRTEELEVDIDTIEVNPAQAAFGNIELEHPTDASVRMVLTEADIDRAFNSSFVQQKIPSVDIEVDGNPKTVTARNVAFGLPGDGKIAVKADIFAADSEAVQQIAFSAVPAIAASGRCITLENIDYADDEISPELTAAILDSVSDLLDLRNFEVPSMDLRLTELQVRSGQLILAAEATIKAFPGSA